MHSVDRSLSGTPERPPNSFLCWDCKDDGRALVVLLTINPSIPQDMTMLAMSTNSSLDKSGDNLTNKGTVGRDN